MLGASFSVLFSQSKKRYWEGVRDRSITDLRSLGQFFALNVIPKGKISSK